MSTCIVGTRDTPLERGRTHQHVAKPMTYYLCVNRSRSRDTELHVLLLGTCGSRLIAHQQTKHTSPSIQTHAHQHQQWISSTPSTLGSYKYHIHPNKCTTPKSQTSVKRLPRPSLSSTMSYKRGFTTST
jgi:hypothetical protein